MTRTRKIIFLFLLLPTTLVAGILIYVLTWEYGGCFQKIAFSQNGDALLSIENGTEILLWDVRTGHDIRSMRKPYFKGGADYIAFSPDGRTAVSGGTDGIVFWDITDGKMLRVLEGTCPPPTKMSGPCVAVSPDGEKVAAGLNGRTKLWELNTGRKILTFKRKPTLPLILNDLLWSYVKI